MPKRKEIECMVPDTTRLKLFCYPHKYGGFSWCVGFERHNSRDGIDFVSQSFLTEWNENYSEEKQQFERWKYIVGAGA